MTDFKGHSPQAGCRAYECGLRRPHECPFMVDAFTESPQPPECQHEWRQYWDHTSGWTATPHGFYCIHNPEHRLAD